MRGMYERKIPRCLLYSCSLLWFFIRTAVGITAWWPKVVHETHDSTRLIAQVQEEVPSRSGRISVVPIPPVEQTIPSIYQDVMSNNLRCEGPEFALAAA